MIDLTNDFREILRLAARCRASLLDCLLSGPTWPGDGRRPRRGGDAWAVALRRTRDERCGCII